MNVEPFSLPLSRPLRTADGTIDSREGFLVRLTVDGVEGVGEATPLPGWTESLEDCEAALRSIDDPVTSANSATTATPATPATTIESGRLDEAPAARHGVSLALLDAQSRAADRPLYRYLGGEASIERVPVNATVGDGPPTETAQAAVTAVEAGFPAVKVKVGARESQLDVERLEAVRERCPDVELRVDANGAWNSDTARRVLGSLATLDVSLAEQPLPAAELEEHARLRDDVDVPLALDEGLLEHGVETVLAADAADAVVCKPMALGGVDVARDVAMTARDAGVDPLVTTTVDGAVARAAAVHLAASIPEIRPCGLATADRLASDLRAAVAPIRAGSALVPQGKGNVPPS